MEDFALPKDALEKFKNPEIIKRHIEEGKSFQDLLGYTNEKMDKFYHSACLLFQAQEYRKSADAFIFLTTLNPYVYNYWLGLGMSEQLHGDYDSALLAYGMAALTNIKDPIPHYHSASCFHKKGELSKTIISLKMAIKLCGDYEQYKELKSLAEKTKKRINQLKE